MPTDKPKQSNMDDDDSIESLRRKTKSYEKIIERLQNKIAKLEAEHFSDAKRISALETELKNHPENLKLLELISEAQKRVKRHTDSQKGEIKN